MKEKRKRYEKLREELLEITFTYSREDYSPERVIGILEEMEKLIPVPESGYFDQEKVLRFIFLHN
ncbi:MAG: hypothetical protein ACI4GD_02425 [Lachnospiraceae bacterium]